MHLVIIVRFVRAAVVRTIQYFLKRCIGEKQKLKQRKTAHMPENSKHGFEKLHSDEKCLRSLAACRLAAPLPAGHSRSEYLHQCFAVFDQCRAQMKVQLSIAL